jgi:DNA-directed RNA polymerase subunit M/transcription elongation factor TFIIS
MKFCSQCDNMYYIGINEDNTNNLIYYCRNCKHIDNTLSSEGSCIINSHSKTYSNFNNIINKYTKDDPTLPRVYNIKCPNSDCKSNLAEGDYQFPEVMYIRYDDNNMKYLYMCNSCDNVWKTNDKY